MGAGTFGGVVSGGNGTISVCGVAADVGAVGVSAAGAVSAPGCGMKGNGGGNCDMPVTGSEGGQSNGGGKGKGGKGSKGCKFAVEIDCATGIDCEIGIGGCVGDGSGNVVIVGGGSRPLVDIIRHGGSGGGNVVTGAGD